MNLKKRALALLMCICMIVTLLPVAAFADEPAVVYGQYDAETGAWQQVTGSDGSATYETDGGNSLTLSKTAKPLGDNTYQIDLKVVSTQTTTTTPPGVAATVLVIDVSGSMKGDRIAAAKDAALEFVSTYAGKTPDTGRYVAVVPFSSSGYGDHLKVCGWQDVSTVAGKTAVDNAINGLGANGGTNLDAGLRKANALLQDNIVNGVASKNVIALTDGVPTFYINSWNDEVDAHSSYGCPDTNAATAITAETLRNSAAVYTVCFGAADDVCWEKDSVHAWNMIGFAKEWHKTAGPTVGEFLQDSIATAETYAYNADNTEDLLEAFKAITSSITEGISTGTVTDPMGANISVVKKPDNFVQGENNTYRWELSDAETSTDGDKTVYTYTLSYTVKLDTTGKGFDENAYHPTNGVTTFTSGGTAYYFPVPGVKGTAPRYTVTYNKGANGNLAGQDANGNVKTENIKMHTATPAAPEVIPDDDHYFNGWDKEIAATVTENVTYTAQYAAKGAVTFTGESNDVTYNSAEQSINGITVEGLPDGYTYEGLSYIAKGTDADTYDGAFSGNVVIKDASGNDVTYRFNINTVPGKLTIDKLPVIVTITGHNKSVTYTGSTQLVKGYDAEISSNLYTENDFNYTGIATAAGILVGHYPMNLDPAKFVNNNNNFEVTFNVTDGWLDITNRTDKYEITVEANSKTVTYTGEEQSVSGFKTLEFTVDGQKYTVEGLTAEAKGTDVGTYASEVTGTAVVKDAKNNDVTAQFDVKTVDGELVITPATDEVVVTITGNNASKVYSGAEQSVTGFTTDVGDKPITVALADGVNAEAKGTDVGKYDMGLTADSFVVTSDNYSNIKVVVVDGYLDITPITDEVTVTITGNHDSVVYNGAEQSVTGFTTDVGDKPITVALKGGVKAEAKGTDVGTYTMGLTADSFAVTSDNYSNIKVVVVDGYLDITPITDKVVVTITGNNGTFTYDGEKHEVKGYDVSIGNKLYSENDFSFTGTAEVSGTNAGSYNMGLKAEDFSNTSKNFTNVEFVVNDGNLTITPAKVTVTVTGNSGTKVYNGEEQNVSGYSYKIDNDLYDVTDFVVDNPKAVGTDAGTYPMNLTTESVKNLNKNFDVTFVVNDGSLTIAKRDVTITSATDSKVYDGKALTNDNVTAVGFVEGEGASYNVTGSQTTVGSSDNEFTYALGDNTKAANYSIKTVFGKLTVTAATTEIKVVANSNSWVYDGKDHADGGYTVVYGNEKYEVKAGESATLSTGDTVTAVITKTVKHVADTAEGNNVIIKLSVSNADSYATITKESGTLTITAAPLTITAGSNTQPYIDGVVRCDEYTNTPLVEGDKIVSVKITGEQEGSGSSPNVASDAVINNAAGEDVTADYDITYVDGLLEGIPYLVKDVHFNYIMGYKDGTIRPNNNISRAEVATIFFRLLTDESREYFWQETNDFSDVADNYWASPAISTLTNAGILKGYKDGTFRPRDTITRAEMATIIARFANLTENKVTFKDIEGHWAQDAIELAAGNGWIFGYEDNTFCPDNNITRAATIAMINRVLERHVVSVDDLLPDMKEWIDNMDTSYTFYFEIQEATNYHECERIDNSPNEKWTAKLPDIDWTKYEFQS